MAKRIAAGRGQDIHFEVGDVCELPLDGKQYDLIVDSYCLQCIVFDTERERLFSAAGLAAEAPEMDAISSALSLIKNMKR